VSTRGMSTRRTSAYGGVNTRSAAVMCEGGAQGEGERGVSLYARDQYSICLHLHKDVLTREDDERHEQVDESQSAWRREAAEEGRLLDERTHASEEQLR
jgi:hypothetical protein